jgi:predicted acetyltransferase
MNLRLMPPSLASVAGYAAALEAGWSPDNERDVSSEELDAIRRDAAEFICQLAPQDGFRTLPSGARVPWLPGKVFWLDDGEFCGTINLRYAPGTERLPAHINGHVGYAVVPWKRRRGYATEALRLLLPVAREVGLRRLQITCDEDNEPSRRVIAAKGGVFERRYRAANGKTKLSFWISLDPAQPS